MSQISSTKIDKGQQASPVYFHINPKALHQVENYEDVKDNRECSIDNYEPENDFCVRRPRKPKLNVSTAKLMGKTKTNNNKRFRSTSASGKLKCGQKIQDTGKMEVDTLMGRQELCGAKVINLVDASDAMDVPFNGEKPTNVISGSNDKLKFQENKFSDLKQEIDRGKVGNICRSESHNRMEATNAIIQTIIETELSVDRCEHLILHVFDYLKNTIKEGHRITDCDMVRLEEYFRDTEDRLHEFKCGSEHLRTMLKQFQQQDLFYRETGIRGDNLLKQRSSALEKAKMELEVVLSEKNELICHLRKELNIKNDDSINFASTQESLETVKGHLQLQLKQKLGDCNRMAVQVRVLENKLIKERFEKERLMIHLKRPKTATLDDRENLKKAARAQKQKAEKAEKVIYELTSILSEKDRQLEQLLIKKQIRHDDRKLSEDSAINQATQYEIQQNENSPEASEAFVNDNVSILDKNQPSDQNSLTLSLQEENEHLRSNINRGHDKLIALEHELESFRGSKEDEDKEVTNRSVLIQKLEASESTNKLNKMRIEELERKIKGLEGRNIDLNESSWKNDVTEHKNELEKLTMDNMALKRQLETALAESTKSSGNCRPKFLSVDQKLQSQIPGLESQLSLQRAETTKWRRSCEEQERKFNDVLQETRLQLETAETKNISLSTYIRYLKKSYANVFGDIPLSSQLSGNTLYQIGGPVCF